MIRLLITGDPGTITAQQKGINWKKRAFYTKTAVKAERTRMKRNLHVWIPRPGGGGDFVRMKTLFPSPFIGPVHVSVKFIFPFTQDQARRHVAQLGDPAFETGHGVRPDFDNSLKLLLDVLTELNFWTDDAQIDDANVHKRRGSDPRILIAIDAC